MKKQLIFAALGAIFLASCADTWDREYSGVNPQKEGYEYLAEYLHLKEYVDRAKYPNFKLGIATTASEYTKQQLVYALVNSNADETVAGNAMKMASCVDDKGNMSFDNAVTFVNSATDAGLNVYGHTLAWHAQQPNKFLNGL
ncbi:MAG: endo-1,4-beta-xylanase, partial [Bacteroides sp.]|nr:endo-1,4-beta-xylanase [Bacteroides sp.]